MGKGRVKGRGKAQEAEEEAEEEEGEAQPLVDFKGVELALETLEFSSLSDDHRRELSSTASHTPLLL